MMSAKPPFFVVILAGDREPNDPVALHTGVSCKALTPVSGRAMVLRVLDALEGAHDVSTPILVGPSMIAVEENAELAERLRSNQAQWMAPQETPSTSAFNALQSLPEEVPVLLTTADHALLSPEMLDHFCSKARESGCDVVAGVARHELIAEAFPGSKRTVTKLNDGGYCGCNLFAFLTPQGRKAADFWRKVEKERKKPLRVIKIIGWTTVLRYLLGRLSLEQALSQLSKKMHLKVGVVRMPFPEAAVDVDKVEDLILVESILAKKQSG
jgi:GTP:adenosylcobinamide-phosphate guanylyltransferase